MNDSRIPGFYRGSIDERIEELANRGWLSGEDARALRAGRQVLLAAAADRMVENVIGVFGLPLAIAPNFVVNQRDCLVPMVVEEPSIVAGLSFAAGLARKTGGFTVSCSESLLIGQVHLSDIDDVDRATKAIGAAEGELLDEANRIHPRLVERGGGVREIALRRLSLEDGKIVLAVHLLVDTCDAMGANLVNTICEGLAPRLADLCAGSVAMRILSNLADRSLATAKVSFRVRDLRTASMDGASVRDAIARASEIAKADPYRATTHNKGIMNGIDAVAVATGNDWRAIEAGAHAFAAETGVYRSLSEWSVDAGGDLVGSICLPLKVGVVGGTLKSNPAAALSIKMTGVESSAELAGLMAAVGLAQNFAALRALATTGIQQGHMRLHARSVVAAAGVSDELFDKVVDELLADGDIKDWKASEIVANLKKHADNRTATDGEAAGKVILLGEHAAVYGKHALAVPIPSAVGASIDDAESESHLSVPEWGLSRSVYDGQDASGVDAVIALIRRKLGVDRRHFSIRVQSRLKPAMGLGASAAFAVAVIRAFDRHLGLGLDMEETNELAYECEKLAHGSPSGIDNTIAVYGKPLLFRKDGSEGDGRMPYREIQLERVPPLVIACGDRPGLTREQVAGVRSRYDANTERYDPLFEQIDQISVEGASAAELADFTKLGTLMNICQGLLNAIGVSTPELEQMIDIARSAGATGAKLTGGGGGGSIVALCPGAVDRVRGALDASGYHTMTLEEGQLAQ